MARFVYTLLFFFAQPLVWLRLAWRARRQPEYLDKVGERYGRYPQPAPERLIWLHVVSVGETRAAEPLIKALLAAYPDHHLLMTHMTPTGRATGGELIGKYGERLIQAYLPYDLPGACARFFTHFRPKVGLLMETELWPNLIASAATHGTPLLLVNARLSARSLRGYQRFLPLIRPALRQLAGVAAQTAADAERLTVIGAENVRVFGNIKFDVTPAAEKLALGGEWRAAFGTRPVWLAASTREDEEALIIDAFIRHATPDALLLLVPRHPQRFDAVAALVGTRQLTLQRRSGGVFPDTRTRVWLGDSMGEMPAYFAAADIVLMGGTFLPFGGQNLIEAAACGCPVLVGQHTFNFAQATEDAIACGAARRLADADAAAAEAARLLQDRDVLVAMRQAAVEFSQAHRGATARTVALVEEIRASRKAD
ncbi:3-deoxy-D-manno-octulosonic-acid transferase [Propionivibrio dicarboxylicus]|uniref:3-deoxy-D-manno-octulosonic acid transferase n=2 Tax=Propionivibrio dicarboxylicus TaxID=83767 RepID=A0A1G7VMM4_9RHOO|nr:3-deoxy-D-manno-octulosonic-acid transferase [Propionivibrio dicarboxylicus]